MPPEANEPLTVSVSQFIALINNSFEYVFPSVVIEGELANFRVSKSKWVYFDLKDENSSLKFFGTVFHLPGPLENGMLLKVKGVPRLHNLYGFSVNIQAIQPSGEGSIRRAADLLRAKLTAEGLFEPSRKRRLPYPPARIGLITSAQSAAYADFIKILAARWAGITVELIDVQVQGEVAVQQIVEAIEQCNALAIPPEVVVIIRGGGSAEDLAAFSSEQVVRAVAASRVPTLIAIGHEIDICLAELAADQRASTPSNAAELLVPDRSHVIAELDLITQQITHQVTDRLSRETQKIRDAQLTAQRLMDQLIRDARIHLDSFIRVSAAFDPKSILRRGYAIVRQNGKTVRRGSELTAGGIVQVQLIDAHFDASVKTIISD